MVDLDALISDINSNDNNEFTAEQEEQLQQLTQLNQINRVFKRLASLEKLQRAAGIIKLRALAVVDDMSLTNESDSEDISSIEEMFTENGSLAMSKDSAVLSTIELAFKKLLADLPIGRMQVVFDMLYSKLLNLNLHKFNQVLDGAQQQALFNALKDKRYFIYEINSAESLGRVIADFPREYTGEILGLVSWKLPQFFQDYEDIAAAALELTTEQRVDCDKLRQLMAAAAPIVQLRRKQIFIEFFTCFEDFVLREAPSHQRGMDLLDAMCSVLLDLKVLPQEVDEVKALYELVLVFPVKYIEELLDQLCAADKFHSLIPDINSFQQLLLGADSNNIDFILEKIKGHLPVIFNTLEVLEQFNRMDEIIIQDYEDEISEIVINRVIKALPNTHLLALLEKANDPQEDFDIIQSILHDAKLYDKSNALQTVYLEHIARLEYSAPCMNM